MLRDPVFWTVYLVLQAFWGVGLLVAWKSGLATASQMRAAVLPHDLPWIPYIWHFGMWSDVVLVHPLCAYLASRFWSTWQGWPLGLMITLLLGVCLASFAHYAWSHTGNIESQVAQGKLMPAGFVHIPHMTLIVAIILLFIGTVATGKVSFGMFMAVAGILVVHVVIGTHWPLGALKMPFFWQEKALSTLTIYVLSGASILLAAVSALFLISRA